MRATLICLSMLVGCLHALGDEPAVKLLEVDDLMAQDPPLSVPDYVRTFSPRLKTLWLAALERPDAETRRQAAGTIGRAIERGVTDLESTIGPLRQVLQQDADLVVRRAAARALVALDARVAAEELAVAADRDGLQMALVVEPALARWDHVPYRERWRARLSDASTPHAPFRLAIESLGVVRDAAAVDDLVKLVKQTSLDAPSRMAAARALGNIRDDGLADLAKEVSGDGGSKQFLDRLVAAQLLARQTGPAAIALLQVLAVDQEPAIARMALERLYALDQAAARTLAKDALASKDAALRQAAARMLVAQGDGAAIRLLRPLLDDRNPTLRRYVAARFVEFGRHEELKPVVLEEATAMLAGDSWRGLEQASLVLGTLDHKPAAARFLELLKHNRTEVMVTAAWGLRKLRLPETLGPALAHAKSFGQAKLSGPGFVSHQVSQLFQLFGDLRYKEAESHLMQFVPKSQLRFEARMSAIWALGCLLEGQAEHPLAPTLAGRLIDTSSSPAENMHVRRMCAVALGKMKAKGQLKELQQMAPVDTLLSLTGAASYWAIEQITGEKPPRISPPNISPAGWFLEPTRD